MNINESGCRPYGMALALMVIGCIRVIPRHPPFFVKEEALPACKETIVRNIPWSLRDRVNATDLNVLQGKAYKKPC